MRKITVGLLSIILILFLTGCVNNPEVKEAFAKSDKIVSDTYEQIGIDEIVEAKNTNGEFEYQFDEPFTGEIFILASKEQIENNISEEEFFANDTQFEKIIEDSSDDFNIRRNGTSYFSVQKATVKNIDNLLIKTKWNDDFLLVFAPQK
ncbi:hypothetical protein [Streptococcus sp. CSL10205-OR2]|uniref:hypothetical protein n=1 Tax=Streptococcus sp. CSL10205-OR2 TaxID=2980558 RepID=UPI0021DB1AFE|nr:hypothetical protein [Streptococcus sp. CSL10205-OR2]MCU9533023.1 hypothetical protein [Streptococcus sp. CSL10205-OR2]